MHSSRGDARLRALVSSLPALGAAWLALGSSPAPACPTTVRELRVPMRSGHVIAARLTLPVRTPRASRAPVVLMISGAGPQDRDYSTVASVQFANHFFERVEERLACASIGAVRFDEVGTGHSTGSYQDYATTMTLANDVVALVDAVRRQSGVGSTRIAVLGHSEGGAIAGIVASRVPSVAAVVLLGAPVERGEDIMRFQIGLDERRSPTDGEAAHREHARRSASDRWYRFFLGFSPAPYYARLRQPLLVLHGDYDDMVTPAQADSILHLARTGGDRFVYCRRYAEIDHGFYGSGVRPGTPSPEVLADIVRFARLTLVSGRPPSSPGKACRRESAGPFRSSATTRRAAITLGEDGGARRVHRAPPA